MAWYNRSGETFFKVSFDRGNGWDKYQQDFYGPGHFVANEQGNLYCLEDQPHGDPVRELRHSLDYGVTWEKPVSWGLKSYLSDVQPPTNLQVASDNNGRFHCVWNIETDLGDNNDYTLMTNSFDLPLPGGNN